MILTGNETVPYALTRPKLPASTAPVPMGGGNFTVRDDFAETLAGEVLDVHADRCASRGTISRPRRAG